MDQYQKLVADVLREGNYKPNRTGVDTISSFSQHYEVDLQEGYPLLTTKKMDGYRWNSMIHELFWYLSGEEHIRNLREETKIWDAWADDEGRLDTAYGRFWRRYPLPMESVEGETWANGNNLDHVNLEGSEYGRDIHACTFDQIGYVIDELKNNPSSRRLVVNAWHPANATVSTLPPCHYTFVFNVQGDRLNCHLTQRSGDIALGVPFNIACYSLLTEMIAQEVGLEVGTFAHTIVDAHIYCGEGERGEWYAENLEWIQQSIASDNVFLDEIVDAIDHDAPADPDNLDHVPGLLEQLQRITLDRPEIEITNKPFDELGPEDIELVDYDHYPGIDFGVAE